jgi:hypothetical protein
MVCSPLSNIVLRLDAGESPASALPEVQRPRSGGRIPELGGLQPDFKAVLGLFPACRMRDGASGKMNGI